MAHKIVIRATPKLLTKVFPRQRSFTIATQPILHDEQLQATLQCQEIVNIFRTRRVTISTAKSVLKNNYGTISFDCFYRAVEHLKFSPLDINFDETDWNVYGYQSVKKICFYLNFLDLLVRPVVSSPAQAT